MIYNIIQYTKYDKLRQGPHDYGGIPLGPKIRADHEKLPEQLKGTVPTIEELEAELGPSEPS